MTPRELYDHPIVRALIPDDTLRREYMTCLEIFDHFSFYNKGKHALWKPGEMKKLFIRWMSLGFKGEAIYPPNLMTWLHDLVFHMMY